MTITQKIQGKLTSIEAAINAALASERYWLRAGNFARASTYAQARACHTAVHMAFEDLLNEIENSAPAEPVGVLSLRAGDAEPIAKASERARSEDW